jgi:hypothetical protein
MEVEYPFVVGNKVVKISGHGLNNAIDRITTRYQNKLINITHARNMDLISAKVEAAKRSRTEKRKIYIIVDEKDGECDLSHIPLKGVYACYNNGSEIALEIDAPVTTVEPRPNKKKLPAQSEKAKTLISKKDAKDSALNESSNSNSKIMATKTAPAKKAATKKVAAKKRTQAKRQQSWKGYHLAALG